MRQFESPPLGNLFTKSQVSDLDLGSWRSHEGSALFCPNERDFTDQGVERKVRLDHAVEDCLDGRWTE